MFRNKAGFPRETLSQCDDNQGLFALPFGIRRLGTFICEISPDNVRLGAFALQQSLGILCFGTVVRCAVWELLFAMFALEFSSGDSRVGSAPGIFRLASFAWELSRTLLGNTKFGKEPTSIINYRSLGELCRRPSHQFAQPQSFSPSCQCLTSSLII